jgi:hypothetical protein
MPDKFGRRCPLLTYPVQLLVKARNEDVAYVLCIWKVSLANGSKFRCATRVAVLCNTCRPLGVNIPMTKSFACL